MMSDLKFTALERDIWIPVTGSSISSVASTGFAPVNEADGIRFYEFGPAWAGVLFKKSIPLLPLTGQGTATFSFTVNTDDAGQVNGQCQEFDIMLVGPKGEVYNGSEQLNNAEGGHWQCVNGGYHWADIGFNPGLLPANTPIPISYTMAFDTAAQTSSIISVTVNGKTFTPPTPLVIAAQQLGWQPNLAVLQVQLDENGKPGAYSEKLTAMSFEVTFGL